MVTYEVSQRSGAVDTFRTDRIIGERMAASHIDYLGRMHQIPEVMATMGGVRTPDESLAWLASQLDHWEQFGFGQWMLRAGDGAFVGRGGLRMIDQCVGEEVVEVGYAFAQEAWGQGFATEATGAFVSIAQSHYKLSELGAITLKGNDASTRVLEKNGFVFERWVEHSTGPHKFLRRRLG